jgi:DNA-binding CsgD family transcriptional regulator
MLTPTERRILSLLADYKTSKQIGEELFISRRTVDHHRANICLKLDIHGSHALMRFALEHKDLLRSPGFCEPRQSKLQPRPLKAACFP